MKIAACDDDAMFLQELDRYLKQYSKEYNCKIEYHMFANPLELVAQIEKEIHYDVIFLDILMPGINGIQCAKDIRTYDNYAKIIFLTCSADFAVESYVVRAYHYLLKPVKKENLFVVLNQLANELTAIKENILVVKCKVGIVKISLSKLEYCEMINRKIILYMTDGKEYECSMRMNDLEQKLEPFGIFLRPHRSYLVNMDCIQVLTMQEIIMGSNVKIPVPRDKYAQVKQLYMQHIFHSANSVFGDF